MGRIPAADRMGILDRRLSQAAFRHPGYDSEADRSDSPIRGGPAGHPVSQFYTVNDHFVLLPALMLCLFGSAVLLFDLFMRTAGQKRWLVAFTLAGLAFTGV